MKRRDQPYETAVSWKPSHCRDRVIRNELLAVLDLEYRSACVTAATNGVGELRRLRAKSAFLDAQRALHLPATRGGGLPAAIRHLRVAQRQLGVFGSDQLAVARHGVRVGGASRIETGAPR